MSEPDSMHLTAIIESTLNKVGWGKLLVTPEQFSEVESFLERKEIQYSYNSLLGILRFRMPTWIHQSGARWMQQWVTKLERSGDIVPDSLEIYTNVTLENFEGDYRRSKKIPDIFLIPQDDTIWPTVALEIGYSESLEDLLADAELLLRGTDGRIRTVIIVKLQPLGGNDTHIEAGFVEVHGYDPETGVRRKRGRRMTLYPLPRNHTHQRIELDWEDIFEDRLDLVISQSEMPPPLMLDDLRDYVERNTRRRVMQRTLRQGSTQQTEGEDTTE